MKILHTILTFLMPPMIIADLFLAHIYYSNGFHKIGSIYFITAVVWIVAFFFNLTLRAKIKDGNNT
jgi:hypothetical protein